MFYDAERFQHEIEEIVWRDDVTVLDAIITFCNEKNVDVEDVKPLISPFIKNKLYLEGMERGILKKEPTVNSMFDEP